MIYLVFDGSCDRRVIYATVDKNDAIIFIRNFVRRFRSKWDKPYIEVYEDTPLKIMLEKIENAEDEYDVNNWVNDIEEETV